MPQLLPEFPNLEHLRGQAKDVLRLVRRRNTAWKLARAQCAVARGYGFTGWPDLKAHVESLRRSPAASIGRRLTTGGECDAGKAHPIAGTWILNASRSTSQMSHLHDGVMLAFSMTGGTITMTQVLVDPAGHDMAIKIVVRADGSAQPVRFGKGPVLEACLTEPQTLEAVIRDDEQIISKGAYTVSADGKTLTFVTSAMQIAFDRM